MFNFEKLTGHKADRYRQLLSQLDALLSGESHWLANAANTAALLYEQLPDVNWAGFYFMEGDELILGPFGGKPACVHIPIGKGVCGTAAKTRRTQVVADVHAFPGHIACDAASRSEIVVPIVFKDCLVGVLDIDSPVACRFDDTDRRELERVVALLSRHTNWNGRPRD
ncbi:GAF domain-containing protein [Numidum massiliense]|uniref:GAF domain-containing protein n=1 Tax=Numidum massiliense TaxID=1522315 RepID=UPI0006D53A29|nr:GAF domain-containing protein [Numidum massiliense]